MSDLVGVVTDTLVGLLEASATVDVEVNLVPAVVDSSL